MVVTTLKCSIENFLVDCSQFDVIKTFCHKIFAIEIFVLLIVLGMVRRKTLVLDLDETLIHSHHDGVLRQTVKPGTPPDFVLKVSARN